MITKITLKTFMNIFGQVILDYNYFFLKLTSSKKPFYKSWAPKLTRKKIRMMRIIFDIEKITLEVRILQFCRLHNLYIPKILKRINASFVNSRVFI